MSISDLEHLLLSPVGTRSSTRARCVVKVRGSLANAVDAQSIGKANEWVNVVVELELNCGC